MGKMFLLPPIHGRFWDNYWKAFAEEKTQKRGAYWEGDILYDADGNVVLTRREMEEFVSKMREKMTIESRLEDEGSCIDALRKAKEGERWARSCTMSR